MAVDLIVSALSKYWSGDYVTPVMQEAWALGAAYNIARPTGITSIHEGVPYGGEDAPHKRRELVSFVEQMMAVLPIGAGSRSWDERSDCFGFYRVDPEAFGELVKQAEKGFTKRVGMFGRIKGDRETVSHLGNALIFIPVDFTNPLDIEGKIFSSLHAAKRELDAGDWSNISHEALKPIIEAFAYAIEKNLPLVVDL